MLHFLLQEHHLMPDEVYKKPRGVKNFIYASTLLRIEEEKKAEQKANMRR